jgi:hypothetical protein
MKNNMKNERQKLVRRIKKEQWKIWDQRRDLPDIELDKPIRHGWYKEIVLTENLERYNSKEAVEKIFAILNKYHWGRTKDECDKQWENQRSKHFIFRDVPTISKRQFSKLSDRAKVLCTPFQFRENRKWITRFYVRIPVHAYRIKYTRAYITHRKRIDPNLESRLAQLENKLKSPGIYEPVQSWDHWRRDHWEKEFNIKRSRIGSKQALGNYKNASARSAIEQLWERN